MKLFKLLVVAVFLVTCSSYAIAKKSTSTPTKKTVAKHKAKKNRKKKRAATPRTKPVPIKKAAVNNDSKAANVENQTYKKKQSEVDKQWEKKADRNNDGYVGKKEIQKYRKSSKTPKINGVSLTE